MDGLCGRDVVVRAAVEYVELEVCSHPHEVLKAEGDPVPQRPANPLECGSRDAYPTAYLFRRALPKPDVIRLIVAALVCVSSVFTIHATF